MKHRTTLAILAVSVLALGAFAAPVLAQGDSASDSPRDQQDRRTAAEDKRDAAQEKREAAQEKRGDAQERQKERCMDSNSTLNRSEQRGCEKVKAYKEHAFKARREGHALMGAIAAMERNIGRLEVREIQLQQQLDSGNFTGNHTAEEVQAKIDKIQDHQDRLAAKVLELQERMQKLHDKWAAVRDHVEKRRHGGDDDVEYVDDAEESESEADEESEDESESSSSTTSSTPA